MLLEAAGGAHKLLISFGEAIKQEQKCNIFNAFRVHKNAKILYSIDVTNFLRERKDSDGRNPTSRKQGTKRKKYWKG